MKSKVLKILVMIIILFSMLYVPMPTSQAGLMDSIKIECPTIPGKPSPPSQEYWNIPNPKTDTTIYRTVYGYSSISGTVQEDLGYDLNIDKYKLPIEGVIVELLDSSGKVYSSMRTGSNGAYYFAPPDGTYSVRFKYGDLNGQRYSEEYEKQILKYNGYDYLVESVQTGGRFLGSTQSSITTGGKGCAQVYIALDNSYSMRQSIIVNGERTTRLKIAVEATKKLIHELLDSGENIYVGLVTFSGDSDIVCGLTNEEWILLERLNEVEKTRYWTWTNIKRGLEACENGFANKNKDDSNRTIVLISDGIPTAARSSTTNTYPSYSGSLISIYLEDSTATVNNKLNQIKSYTQNTVKRLKDDGVRLVSLFTEATQEENDFVEDMLGKQSDLFSFMKDGDETVKKLTTDLKEYLMTTTEEKEYDPEYITIEGGAEDKARRAEVNANFEGRFYYNHEATEDEKNTIRTSIFQGNTEEDRQELSDLASMWGWGGKNYKIERVTEHTETEVHEWTEDDRDYKETIITKYVNTEYKNQNITLKPIPVTFMLDTKVTATNLEVILSDGKILSQPTLEVGDKKPIVQALDQEIAHGATVQVEYTIRISNTSGLQCDYLELIAYVPKDLQYVPSLNQRTNKWGEREYWEVVDLAQMESEGYITSGQASNKEIQALKIVLDNQGRGENGFVITSGGHYDMKLVLSQVISNLENFGGDKQIAVEILGYENQANRRIATKERQQMVVDGKTVTRVSLVGAYPGNGQEQGIDFNISNLISVLPPFGRKSILTQLIIVATGFGLIIAVTTTVIIKRRKNRKIL